MSGGGLSLEILLYSPLETVLSGVMVGSGLDGERVLKGEEIT